MCYPVLGPAPLSCSPCRLHLSGPATAAVRLTAVRALEPSVTVQLEVELEDGVWMGRRLAPVPVTVLTRLPRPAPTCQAGCPANMECTGTGCQCLTGFNPPNCSQSVSRPTISTTSTSAASFKTKTSSTSTTFSSTAMSTYRTTTTATTTNPRETTTTSTLSTISISATTTTPRETTTTSTSSTISISSTTTFLPKATPFPVEAGNNSLCNVELEVSKIRNGISQCKLN